MSKPKVGFYWCASCGGCEESVVDLAEDILEVVEAIEFAFFPVAMDFKRADVESLADNELAVTFINGAVRTSEHLEMAQLLRRKSQLLFAYGSCAHLGGIPGLANFTDAEAVLNRVYREMPTVTNEQGTVPSVESKVPEGVLELPQFWNTVKTLDQVVDVDYYIPGCPPPVKLLKNALALILEGTLPQKGSILAPNVALCMDCPRKKTKPDTLLVKEFKRPHQAELDPERCFLDQGFLCMGPVTRSGCDNACINGNMPCSGCLGPLDGIRDYGAKALSAFASILDYSEPEEIEKALDAIADPGGSFYRYSLPASLIHRRHTGGDGKLK